MVRVTLSELSCLCYTLIVFLPHSSTSEASPSRCPGQDRKRETCDAVAALSADVGDMFLLRERQETGIVFCLADREACARDK